MRIIFMWRWLLVLLVFTTVTVDRSSLYSQERFDWMPAEASSGRLRSSEIGGEQIVPEVVLTKTPKPTADISKFTKIYMVDLKKFGIRNDGTHPEETSAGINNALQDAKQAGANRIDFPAGKYLISEKTPVLIDLKDAVIDLHGAILQINSNGLKRYSVVEFIDGAENVRLTNGTLVGDRDTHDYKADPSTHEWGAGIRFVSGRHLEVDHITSRNMTGDGVSSDCTGTRNRDELLRRIMYSVYKKDLESGAFNDAGEKVESNDKIRSIKPFDVTRCDGAFELGFVAGYMGYPFIKGRVYRAFFYDNDMKLVKQQKCLQYRKVEVPDKARWMHVEFHQPEISDEPAHVGAAKGSWLVRITNFRPSTDVHFHDNLMINNRRLGMAFCGGQRWLIENNRFDENGGTNPAYGVDFEDGAELMQDVVFRKNKFKGNRGGDLVVCAGSELIFEDNEFEKSVVVWGRAHNYEFRRNEYDGNVHYTTRTGVAKIHDNHYRNGKLSITFDTKAVADGLVRKPGKTVSTPPLLLENETLSNVSSITGTYFNFSNSKVHGCTFIAGKETQLIRFMGGNVTDSSLVYEAVGPNVDVKIDRVDGAIHESGPGMSRKK